jgi:hypothetical protein
MSIDGLRFNRSRCIVLWIDYASDMHSVPRY